MEFPNHERVSFRPGAAWRGDRGINPVPLKPGGPGMTSYEGIPADGEG